MKQLLSEVFERVKPDKKTILDYMVGFFSKDYESNFKMLIDLMKQPGNIRDAFLWCNFICFLKEGEFDDDLLIKLAQKLEEDGDSKDGACQLVRAIDSMESTLKVQCLSHLTQALIHDQLPIGDYYKLIYVLKQLTDRELNYLKNEIETGDSSIRLAGEHNEDFALLGIMRLVNGGYVYTKRAYLLVECGLSYGKNIKVPEKIPDPFIVSIDAE